MPTPQSPYFPFLTNDLLCWAQAQGRHDLPWRILPSESSLERRLWRIWVSEVMLQQTTVATVVNRYATFIDRFPDVQDMSGASVDDVLAHWAGLGYYSRARNLHKAAQQVMQRHQGLIPKTVATLTELSGVGSYTARAIVVLGLGIPTLAVDTNVRRILNRVSGSERTAAQWHGDRSGLAVQMIQSVDSPAELQQALFDLGSKHCRSRYPDCATCPILRGCVVGQSGEFTPEKRVQTPIKSAFAHCVVLFDQKGSILLRRRPDRGILASTLECPTSPFVTDPPDDDNVMRQIDLDVSGHVPLERLGVVHHRLTHRALSVQVWRGRMGDGHWVLSSENGDSVLVRWMPKEEALTALPTLMRKVIQLTETF